MGYKIIPLTTDPDQTFTVTIPVDGKNITVDLRVRYNTQSNYWWLSVSQSGSVLLDSIPLLTSDYPAGDILQPYRYLNLGSAALIKTSDIQQQNPDSANLGTDFVLVWGDTVDTTA